MRSHNDDAGQERSPEPLSRREVLGAGLAAAQLIAGATAAAQPPEPIKGKDKMRTRKLGRLEVSELGFGNMGLSGAGGGSPTATAARDTTGPRRSGNSWTRTIRRP
ncbi:MAG: hypothetical protein SH850_23290, partial [Planctomycetaceae bacterium]|nr:hypothetical protein [Planctomycetaceae bacterium]